MHSSIHSSLFSPSLLSVCDENVCPWCVWVLVCVLRDSFVVIPCFSEVDTTSAEVSIIIRKDNSFLNPRGKKRSEEEEREEEERVVPNLYKDDLARRRAQSGTAPQRDPRQSLAQTSITQSDLEKWQRLSMITENRCI